MATAAVPASGSQAATSARWLYGPATDLLLGCGLLWACIFAIHAAAGPSLRAVVPPALAPLLALVTATPHYGATLLRVYEHREDRQRWLYFALHGALLFGLLFLAGLWSATVGCLLVTVYLTWSPWHYSGQNYGLALMFLGRRGIAVDADTKRWLWLCFVLSFGIAFLALHASHDGGSAYEADVERAAAAGLTLTPDYRFLPLGLPGGFVDVTLLVLGVGFLACAALAFARLRRTARARDLLPTATLVGTQAMWFAVPAFMQRYGWMAGIEPWRADQAQYAFFWIVVGHSLQYLWVSAYYARRSDPARSTWRWYALTLVAGGAVWGIPAILFAPDLFGTREYSNGLRLVVASIVNLHHFVLDGAIWKLRDGRIARVLVRAAAPAAMPELATPARRSWIAKPALAVAGILGLFATGLVVWETEVGWTQAAARRDVARMETAAWRLDLVGAQSSSLYLDLALLKSQQGELDAALRFTDAALALRPLPRAHYLQGQIHEARGERERALASYEAARALTPERRDVLEAVERMRSATRPPEPAARP